MTTTRTPTSGAADLPKALRLADAISDLLCSSEVAARTIAAAADELVRLHALAAGQATAQADSVQEDAARLDWLDQQCEGYGFQDIHEGNRWEISGPYANVRQAIDYERAASKQGEKQ